MTNTINPITLSICIPTYNREKEFSRMIKGLVPQLQKDIEIVIRDDSTDDSTKKIFENAINGLDISYQYYSGDRIGVDRAVLFMIEKARGDFIWLFSDDDEFLPGAIKSITDLIKSDRDLTWIWANFDSDLGVGLHVKNRNSGYFNDRNEAITIVNTGIGLISTQIYRREIGLLGLERAKKHIKGFSFASTVVYLSVLASNGRYYFMNGPYVLCHPTTPDEIIQITNKNGKINNPGFYIYGINFYEVVNEYASSFSQRAIYNILTINFRSLWTGMIVAWVGGWDDPKGKRIKMMQYYWKFPEAWVALFCFCMPNFFIKYLYYFYKILRDKWPLKLNKNL